MSSFKSTVDEWSRSNTSPEDWHKLILDNETAITAEQGAGRALLVHACRIGSTRFFQQLLNISRDNAAFARAILPDDDPDGIAQTGRECLAEAASNGHSDIFHALLARAAWSPDAQQNSLLHLAAGPRGCHPRIIQTIVQMLPASVWQLNSLGQTPLDVLVQTHSRDNPDVLDCARVLFEDGLAVADRQPLARALGNGDVDMCRLLIDSGGAGVRSILNVNGFKRPSFVNEEHLIRSLGQEHVKHMLNTISNLSAVTGTANAPA